MVFEAVKACDIFFGRFLKGGIDIYGEFYLDTAMPLASAFSLTANHAATRC